MFQIPQKIQMREWKDTKEMVETINLMLHDKTEHQKQKISFFKHEYNFEKKVINGRKRV